MTYTYDRNGIKAITKYSLSKKNKSEFLLYFTTKVAISHTAAVTLAIGRAQDSPFADPNSLQNYKYVAIDIHIFFNLLLKASCESSSY